MFARKPKTSEIKKKYRRNLHYRIDPEKKRYVIDTSAVINRFIPGLVKRGLKGSLIVPNAVMAELENMANKGREEGFIGLEEIDKFHKIKTIKIIFEGSRPGEMQIKFAKSGEIDALIRESARKNQAILITSDLVQAKTAKAYGLEVIFLRARIKQKKKSFFFWKRK